MIVEPVSLPMEREIPKHQNRDVQTEAYFQSPFVAAEQRPIVAHGETVGHFAKTIQAPDEAAENRSAEFSFAPFWG